MWPDTVSKSHYPYRLGDDLILKSELDHSQQESDLPFEFLRIWLNIAMFLIQHIGAKCIYIQYTCILCIPRLSFYRCIHAAFENQRINSSPVCFELRMWSVYIAPLPSWDREWRSSKTRPGPIEKWDPYPGCLMIVGNQEKYGNIYVDRIISNWAYSSWLM